MNEPMRRYSFPSPNWRIVQANSDRARQRALDQEREVAWLRVLHVMRNGPSRRTK